MPYRAPRICSCGRTVSSGDVCPCKERAARERKARFDKTRPSARQRGYTAEWERESKSFLQAHPRCFRCGAPATVVHHSIPHRGNVALFWDRSKWMPSCKPCHDGPLQAAERRPGGGSELSGPLGDRRGEHSAKNFTNRSEFSNGGKEIVQ